jgi:hypothetical protein
MGNGLVRGFLFLRSSPALHRVRGFFMPEDLKLIIDAGLFFE